MWWIYPVYIALLVSVVFLSVKLGHLVDLLDRKTKISGAFLGAILLTSVTTLPELFSSISAIFVVGEPELVVGNILGSNLFNMMIIAIATIIFFGNFKKARISKFHIWQIVIAGAFYALAAFAVFFPEAQIIFSIHLGHGSVRFGYLNLISIIILIVYVLLLRFHPSEKDEHHEAKEDNTKITVKQIMIRFAFFAVLLIAASMGIAYAGDIIADELHLGKAIAGVIFLGLATSLPEFVTSMTLVSKKNFDASLGNILGSAVFNFSILALSDVLTVNGSIYNYNEHTLEIGIILACLVVSWLALGTWVFVKSRKQKMKSNKWALLFVPLSVIIIGSYVLSIVLSIIYAM